MDNTTDFKYWFHKSCLVQRVDCVKNGREITDNRMHTRYDPSPTCMADDRAGFEVTLYGDME